MIYTVNKPSPIIATSDVGRYPSKKSGKEASFGSLWLQTGACFQKWFCADVTAEPWGPAILAGWWCIPNNTDSLSQVDFCYCLNPVLSVQSQ